MHKRYLSILISIALLFSLVSPALAAGQNGQPTQSNAGSNATAGSYIIKFKDAEKGKQGLKKNKRAKRSLSFFGINEEKNTEKSYKHLSSVVNATLSASEVSELKQDANVAYIEKDSIVRKAGDAVPTNLHQIHADEAHQQSLYGDKVKVAILDTGISLRSSELHVAGGVSLVPNDTSLEDPNGHGTFVAGVLAALKDDRGLIGTAPKVDLYNVKVLDANGEGTYSQVIQGIEWAIDNQMDVVAMSFAGNDYSLALEEATQLAYNSGILLIAATGNDGVDKVSYPAKMPAVLAVGAVDSSNQLASFSNRGNEVGLVAPGVNLQGLSLSEGKYTTMSGTSMAVPQVAGAAALVKQKNPTLNNKDIRQVLENSAISLGDVTKFGHGLLDAVNAVKVAERTISQGSVLHPSGTSVTGSVYDSVYKVAAAEGVDQTALVNVDLKPNKAPFSIGDSQEQISTMSGGLTLQETEFVLPGRNGLSFALTRMYDSSEAQYYGMGYGISAYDYKTKQLLYFNTTNEGSGFSKEHIIPYSQTRFPIGAGWTWNVPSIEKRKWEGSYYEYLHLPGQGTYQINGTELQGYPWGDLTFSENNSVIVNGMYSKYKLHSLKGKDYFFADNGQLLQISDAYGNAIKFEYSSVGYLKKISDDLENKIEITYPSSNEVKLNLGNREVIYTKTKLDDQAYALSKVTDSNKLDTVYSYVTKDSKFSLVQSSSVSNAYVLLTSVTYPTKAKSVYEYESEPVDKKLSSSSRYVQYYRIKSRHDEMNKNGATVSVNYKDFTYTNSPDAEYGYSFKFSTKVSDGLKATTYSYSKDYGVPRLNSINEQVKDTYQGKDRITNRLTTYKYTQEKTWTVPNTTTLQYDQTVDNVTTPSPAITSSKSYSIYQNLENETNELGVKKEYTYDPYSHLLTSITEPLQEGRTKYTAYVRNGKGTVIDISIRETDEKGTELSHKSFEPDAFGNITKTTIHDDDKKQYVITDIYAADKPNYGAFATERKVTVTDLDGKQTEIKESAEYYPDSGQAKSYTNANGLTTSFVYDNLNRIKTEQFPDGFTKKWDYDDVNNTLTFTDETGVVSTIKWNPLGWKLSEGISGAGVTSYDYDAYGRQKSVSDAAVPAHTTTFVYDNWGRQIEQQYPDQTIEKTYYDDINRTKTETDGEGNQARETYDVLGRVSVEELQKNGAASFIKLASYTYDHTGSTLSSTDANNNTTTFTYDILGRLKSVTEPSPISNKTQYTYNLAGNLTEVQYPDGKTLKKKYDELGRLIQKTNQLDQIDKYYYDTADQTTRHIDPKGVTTKIVNDNRNRLSKSITPQETITFTYDAAGRRKTMQDGTSTVPTTYDYKSDTGQLKTINYPDGKQLSIQYDGTIGNIQTETNPFGVVSAYGYDAQNRLTGVGTALNDWDETYADGAASGYTKNGLLRASKLRNGITNRYTYDWVRVNSIEQKKPDNTILNRFGYEYDLNNNLTSKTENGIAHTYTYDQDNRISTSSQFNEQYTYDARGNRKTLQTSNQSNKAGVSYQYDDRNRLTSVTLENGAQVNYQYNGDGLLYQRTENGQTTRYYYNDGDLIAEGNVSNGVVSPKASYIWGNGLVARVDASGKKAFYSKNGHGDVVALTDSVGNTLNTYSYDMWGNPLTTSEQVSQPFRYSGEFYDSTTGLQYLKARWYDPSEGRFINQDTYEGDITNPLSLNLYTYAHNNPLIYNDPSGHFIDTILDIASIAYDTVQLIKNPTWMNAAYLGLDLLGAAIPFVTGLGTGARAAHAAANTAKVVDDPIKRVAAEIERTNKQIAEAQAAIKKQALEHEKAMQNINNLVSPKGTGKVTGGSFKAVDTSRGPDEVGHHIAQNAYNKTQGISRNDGPAVLMTKDDHAKTRTFAGKGKASMREDTGLGLNGRQRMAKDVWDVKKNFGRKYNEGLKEAVRYGQQIYK